MDLNGARRKNATRETTSTLKAWLNEHKKNPYPTKGEKIMLAIITKMTLTQVSTWFANARRRLKKENKMTWEPRNRVEDEDNNNDDGDNKSTDGKELIGKDVMTIFRILKNLQNFLYSDSKDSGTASSEDGDRLPNSRLAPESNDWNESRHDSESDSPECYEVSHPAFLPNRSSRLRPSPISTSSKPRIWSLADMATKESEGSQQPAPSTFYSTADGRIVPPLDGRLAPPNIHSSPFSKSHELYRSLYMPTAQHHTASGSQESSLVDGTPRSLHGHMSSSVISKATAASGGPSLPLGLTTTSRISPSSASSMSSGSEAPIKPVALNKA